jgi:hypothetical protein
VITFWFTLLAFVTSSFVTPCGFAFGHGFSNSPGLPTSKLLPLARVTR